MYDLPKGAIERRRQYSEKGQETRSKKGKQGQ